MTVPDIGWRLSVVVTSLGDAASLRGALAALAAQTGVDPFEIVIPANARVSALLGELLPLPLNARVVATSASADTWEMRGAGVRASTAPVVATIEDAAVPDPAWARRLLESHAASHGAIGGTVAKGVPDSAPGWAMYFLDYARYIPPVAAGPTSYLSACNVSYKRTALDRVASSWSREMHETDVHWALQRSGETLWIDPGMVVRFRRPLSLGAACAELRAHGRKFARGRGMHTSAVARTLRAATTPLLPLLVLGRTARVASRSPGVAVRWAWSLPAMVPMAMAWAWGEFEGYAGATVQGQATGA